MSIVVSDTSPIRALSHLGRLDLLAYLFQEVVVPPAVRRGLRPLGVIGTLLRAKERGLVLELTPLLDRLQRELGFYISSKLRNDTLRKAGEQE